jgi:hypothetical protein
MEIKTGELKDKLGAIAQEAGEQLTAVLNQLSNLGGVKGKIEKLVAVKVRDDNDNWFYLTGEVEENCTQLIGQEADSDQIHYLTIVELDAYQIIELLDYLKSAYNL